MKGWLDKHIVTTYLTLEARTTTFTDITREKSRTTFGVRRCRKVL